MSIFVHRHYIKGETIAAISTPPGEGGVAIVRISGKNALAVADALFSGNVSSYASHTAHLGQVIDRDGKKLDTALLLVMKGPKSYTGEDTVELQCHGGMIASRRVLQAALDCGARTARGGEFTFKAFMNGKLDLSQAEAVASLIGAKSERAFDAAAEHLEGVLAQKIESFQAELTRIAAILEASVDFPEEGLAFASKEQIVADLEKINREIETLERSYLEGRQLKEGVKLCIVGAPNVGKSSLMNALLQQERAIVTSVAGTTRDLIEEELTINGRLFRLIDTAGIRQTDELVEQEGIARSYRSMQSADLTIFVLDGTKEPNEQEKKLLAAACKEKTLLVHNKCDLENFVVRNQEFANNVSISAKELLGIEALSQALDNCTCKAVVPLGETIVISALHHKKALYMAAENLQKVIEGVKLEISYEFLLCDLRAALLELGTIVGKNVSEDILSSIFSQFCVGK